MGDVENRCICLSISAFEPRSWLNSQPSFRSTAHSFLTCLNEICQPKEAILTRIHLAMHHHWLPNLPSAICVGFGMHRARYHHNEVHCSLSDTCTQAQTMSPYQAPRLSPWGTENSNLLRPGAHFHHNETAWPILNHQHLHVKLFPNLGYLQSCTRQS